MYACIYACMYYVRISSNFLKPILAPKAWSVYSMPRRSLVKDNLRLILSLWISPENDGNSTKGWPNELFLHLEKSPLANLALWKHSPGKSKYAIIFEIPWDLCYSFNYYLWTHLDQATNAQNVKFCYILWLLNVAQEIKVSGEIVPGYTIHVI